MPRIKRGNATQLYLQPGSKLSYKQDRTIQGVRILEGDASLRSSVPPLDSRHPEDTRALCYDVEVESLKNGKIRAVASYIGIVADPTPWMLSGNGTLDKDSIVTHPDFVDKIGGDSAAPKNMARYDDEGKFIEFPIKAPNNLAGIESYFNPSISYRFTCWTYRQPTFNDLGKIDAPPIQISRPTTVKDFLLGSATYHQVGSLYQITLEYWGSGPKGWNPLIYSR